MNKRIKMSLTRQRGTVGALCFMCVLFFAASGCGKQESSVGEDDESPYYYYRYYSDGGVKKVYLSLNTKYASLSLKEPKLPADIADRGITASKFECDNFDGYEYKGVCGTRRYWTELSIEKDLTDEQYLELLADIKRSNSDVIIGPYFNNTSEGKLWGMGHFVSVGLKNEGDEVLLEQMAEQTGSIILKTIPVLLEQMAEQTGSSILTTRRLSYHVCVSEDSELSALECANIFYESGLFQYVQWIFMYHSEGTDCY